MSKRVIDLTDDELETLAGEAWQNAAREALAKGLSVTGSRNGRRLRYYPDGRIEDVGPVSSLPALDASRVEPIAAFRDLAEKSMSQAKNNYEKFNSAANEATNYFESAYATASKLLADYGIVQIEAARANTAALFDFTNDLLETRSLSEVVEVSTIHTRKQFEALRAHPEQLARLAEAVQAPPQVKELAQAQAKKLVERAQEILAAPQNSVNDRKSSRR